VTAGAWQLAQQLDVQVLTEQDLWEDSPRPLTKRRPPRGTLYARQEPFIQDLRDRLPLLLHRKTSLDIELPVFHTAGNGPCCVPDREGNTMYVNARESEYDFE